MYVYVASSWRNPLQSEVCELLTYKGIDHYDFKKAGPSGNGFRWTEVMTSVDPQRRHNDTVHVDAYLDALVHPRTVEAFNLDMGALRRADTTIAILPCNRSAHLELGYAVGAGQRTAVLLDPDDDGQITPELMYMMLGHIFYDVFTLLEWVLDEPPKTLREAAVRVVVESDTAPTSAEVLSEIHRRWGNVFPFASWLDVHDELSEHYGTRSR